MWPTQCVPLSKSTIIYSSYIYIFISYILHIYIYPQHNLPHSDSRVKVTQRGWISLWFKIYFLPLSLKRKLHIFCIISTSVHTVYPLHTNRYCCSKVLTRKQSVFLYKTCAEWKKNKGKKTGRLWKRTKIIKQNHVWRVKWMIP